MDGRSTGQTIARPVAVRHFVRGGYPLARLLARLPAPAASRGPEWSLPGE